MGRVLFRPLLLLPSNAINVSSQYFSNLDMLISFKVSAVGNVDSSHWHCKQTSHLPSGCLAYIHISRFKGVLCAFEKSGFLKS